VLTQSWRSKSAVFRMYHPLSLNGYSKIINAVKRQRNLGLTSIVIAKYRRSLKDRVGQVLEVLLLVSCPKGQVKIYINVDLPNNYANNFTIKFVNKCELTLQNITFDFFIYLFSSIKITIVVFWLVIFIKRSLCL
jgi:hypothetical protein